MKRRVVAVTVLVAAAGPAAFTWHLNHDAATASPTAGPPPVPVVAIGVRRQDVPIYLTGIGAVQAYNTVTVKARVDGQIDKIAFTEGQDVKAGDPLVQIDPRPFQAALDQAIGKKASDAAQLANARIDMQRDVNLAARGAVSQQTADSAKALAAQLEAEVEADQAAIDSAKVQLDYTNITAPISGRTGLRLVDQGNIVHATDQTGLVVITQIEPISVVFTLSEDSLPDVTRAMAQGALKAEALSRDGNTSLGQGTLALIDNQIDQTTGTMRLKGTFPNKDHALWPGQFVNVKLYVSVRHDGITVPAAVVQRGPQGDFAYVIKPDQSVEAQPIKVAQIQDGVALIDSGLDLGEQVVLDGQYKLRPGARVEPREAGTSAVASTSRANPL